MASLLVREHGKGRRTIVPPRASCAIWFSAASPDTLGIAPASAQVTHRAYRQAPNSSPVLFPHTRAAAGKGSGISRLAPGPLSLPGFASVEAIFARLGLALRRHVTPTSRRLHAIFCDRFRGAEQEDGAGDIQERFVQ